MVRRNEKTLISVLASHDAPDRNNALGRLFERLYVKEKELLGDFHFLFTGGTFDRLISGVGSPEVIPISEKVRSFLLDKSEITRLPSRTEGGVTVLGHLIVQQGCNIVWPFLTPLTSHWLNPENLALLRLCDQWHVKKLMNPGSVEEWFEAEASIDANRNRQPLPPTLALFQDIKLQPKKEDSAYKFKREVPDFPSHIEDMTVALIAHNEMKGRMIEFAIDYERELGRFKNILSTGTTGREIEANTRTLEGKIFRYRSGPKGGDIEIATQVLFGRCHVVIFFIDPLNPHPHIEDIRVVLGACMIQDSVRMLTNEMQAREWIRRVIRR